MSKGVRDASEDWLQMQPNRETSGSNANLVTAAALMAEALRLLDEADDPAHVTPHLDLAWSLLNQFLAGNDAMGVAGSIEPDLWLGSVPGIEQPRP